MRHIMGGGVFLGHLNMSFNRGMGVFLGHLHLQAELVLEPSLTQQKCIAAAVATYQRADHQHGKKHFFARMQFQFKSD